MNELELISEPLRRLSASDREIVLPYAEARLALDELAADDIAVPAWEGWLVRFDGTKGHSRRFQGTIALKREQGEPWPDYVDRCRTFAMQTMTADEALFRHHSESEIGTLYYCFYVTSESERPER